MNVLVDGRKSAVIEANVPTIIWGAVGALAGAAATLVLGWLRIRRDDRALVIKGHEGLSRSQREMIESLQQQIMQIGEQRDLDRKFYEAKIEDIRHGYQEAMSEQKRLYEERIRRLEAIANVCPDEDTH